MNLSSLIVLVFFTLEKTRIKHFLLMLFLALGTFCSLSAQKISYTHQNTSLEEISKHAINWTAYKAPIYEGLNNGVYWFKIELDNNTSQILNIPEAHISRANLFYKNSEIEKEENSRYVNFILNKHNNTSKTYYLKVNCLLEARIPIKIQDEHTFYKNEIKEYTFIGLYIGITLLIILINLFTYFTTKNRIYVYYVFMVIGMAINAFYKDGITALLLGINGFNEPNETTLSGIVVISAIFFSTSYLSLNEYLPKVKRLGVFVTILGVLSNIIYLITLNFPVFIVTNILYLLALDIFWFSAVLLWKKSEYARLFTVAYGIPLFFVHDYYISPHFGIHFLNLPLYFYKIGSIFEMIVFTYAIMYQTKKIKQENTKIRKKLETYTQQFKQQDIDITNGVETSKKLIKQFGFTLREIEILNKAANKKTNKQIATELFISENTVKFHIRNILQKLEVKNRKSATLKYLKITKNNT